MGYVAVKGGTLAIEESLRRLKYERLQKHEVLSYESVLCGLRGLIDQVMSESSLYSEEVAALAVKQSEGNPEEAVFLLRAYRSTLPRKHYSLTVESEEMRVLRRISAAFKDIPGGQILGTSFDYSHRLINFDLKEENAGDALFWVAGYKEEIQNNPGEGGLGRLPKVVEYLRKEGVLTTVPVDDRPPKDVTKKMLEFPTVRSERLQILTRGQTGAVTALGYASMRGYGPVHPTVGELRVGYLPVFIGNPLTDTKEGDDGYYVGEVKVTEVESLIPYTVEKGEGKKEIEFEIGYGICYGQNETKAVAMSILDKCLESPEPTMPTEDEEFVLLHIDSVEATGFVSHLKLPHYVTFQSKLDSVRKTKEENQYEE